MKIKLSILFTSKQCLNIDSVEINLKEHSPNNDFSFEIDKIETNSHDPTLYDYYASTIVDYHGGTYDYYTDNDTRPYYQSLYDWLCKYHSTLLYKELVYVE